MTYLTSQLQSSNKSSIEASQNDDLGKPDKSLVSYRCTNNNNICIWKAPIELKLL